MKFFPYLNTTSPLPDSCSTQNPVSKFGKKSLFHQSAQIILSVLFTLILLFMHSYAYGALLEYDTDRSNPSAWIKYSNYSTTNFSVDGMPFYCAQGPKYTPSAGVVDVDSSAQAFELRYGAHNASLIKKVLYYAPGGPGYETHKELWAKRFAFEKNDDHPSLQVEGNRARVYAHEIISYALTDSFGGGVLSADRENFKKHVVYSDYPDTIAKRIMALNPDLERCTFGLVKGTSGSTQDIVGITFYEKPVNKGVLTIHKSLKLVERNGLTQSSSENKDSAQNKLKLEGICFVISKVSGDEVQRIYTDNKGNAHSDELEFGVYHIQEQLDNRVRARLSEMGIVLDEESLIDEYVKLSEEGAHRLKESLYELPLNYTNQEKTAQLSLIKKDSETHEIIQQPCSYALYNNKKELINWVDKQGITHSEFYSSNGKIVFPHRLIAGTYYVKEVRAPRGYVLDETFHPITLAEKKDTILHLERSYLSEVFDQKIEGRLEIYKYDSLKKQPLAGAEFKLSAAQDIYSPTGKLLYHKGEELMRAKSDEQGKVVMGNLPLARYHVEETQAAAGYLLESKIYEVELSAEHQHKAFSLAKIQIENAENRLIVKKVDKLSNKSLTDTHFELTAFKLPENFKIKELTEKLKPSETRAYETAETRLSEASLISEAAETGSSAEAISNRNNAELQNFHERMAGYLKNPALDESRELITDSSGYSYATGLKQGYLYVLRESRAPHGYEIDDSARNYYYVNQDGKLIELNPTSFTQSLPTASLETKRENYPLTKLKISKKDITGTEELPGAHLELWQGDRLVESWISRNEAHVIEGLPVGVYRLKETLAPDGYVLANEIEFELLQKDEIQHVEMRDDYTKLIINKRDLRSHHLLAGAKLALIDASTGTLIESWISDYQAKRFEKLKPGSYLIRELEAPPGYKKATDFKFILQTSPELQEIDFFNQKEPPPSPYGKLPPAPLPKTGVQSRAATFILISLAGFALIEFSIKILHSRR